jgi:hypothetical protein
MLAPRETARTRLALRNLAARLQCGSAASEHDVHIAQLLAVHLSAAATAVSGAYTRARHTRHARACSANAMSEAYIATMSTAASVSVWTDTTLEMAALNLPNASALWNCGTTCRNVRTVR